MFCKKAINQFCITITSTALFILTFNFFKCFFNKSNVIHKQLAEAKILPIILPARTCHYKHFPQGIIKYTSGVTRLTGISCTDTLNKDEMTSWGFIYSAPCLIAIVTTSVYKKWHSLDACQSFPARMVYSDF